MKTKTPDQKNKMKKKETPGKSPSKKVEIIEMNTSSSPRLKTPKTPKLSTSSTPKVFHSCDISDDENPEREIKIPRKHKTPKTQTPNMAKVKTPKLETEFPTPKIKKIKTPKEETPQEEKIKTQSMEAEFPTPKIKKVKTPKVEVKTPKMEVRTPKMELKTPKMEVKNSTQKVEKVKTPKTPKSGISEKTSESEKPNKKRKQSQKEEEYVSPKKKGKKDGNKENTPKTKQNKVNQVKTDKTKKLITVFVAPLDAKTHAEAILDLFTQHDINVYEIRKKRGRRFGHVDLLKREDLVKALSLKGEMIEGKAINICEQKEHFNERVTKLKSEMILVKNIEKSVTLDELKEIFPDAVRIKYPKTIDGIFKGYAQVMFDSSEKVVEYVEKLNQQELKGEKLTVSSVVPAKRPSNVLFVRNLNFKTTEKDLKKIFPTSVSIQLKVNKFGKSRGLALVTMKTVEEAKAVCCEKNRLTVDGYQIIISWNSDEGKEVGLKKKLGKDGVSRRKKNSDHGTEKMQKSSTTKQSAEPNTLKSLNKKPLKLVKTPKQNKSPKLAKASKMG